MKSIDNSNHTQNTKNSLPYLPFSLNAQYIKDLSLENPNAPYTLIDGSKPLININIGIDVRHIHEQMYEVTIRADVRAHREVQEHEHEHEHNHEGECSDPDHDHAHHHKHETSPNQVAFIIDMKYSGLFTVAGLDPEQVKGNEPAERTLFVECPRHLFPFLRNTIMEMSSAAGYPPLLLSSFDFESIYQDSREKA